jgi:DNA-binding transcriptional regulator YiaG
MKELGIIDKDFLFPQEIMNLEKIKKIRASYGLTQESFAELLGVKYNTLRSWEGGYRFPSSPAAALLYIADQYPDVFIKNRRKIMKAVKKYFLDM